MEALGRPVGQHDGGRLAEDGRRIDFPCAIVRALGSVFSGMVGGLGFFWCAWDDERQTWHDKLAGTVVVRVEKMPPLV